MEFLKRYYDKLVLGILLLLLVVSMTIMSSSLSKARDSVQIDDQGILDEVYSKPDMEALDAAQFAAAIEVDQERLWRPDPNGEDSTLYGPGRYVAALDGSGYILHFSDKRNKFTGASDIAVGDDGSDPATSTGDLETGPTPPAGADVDNDGLPDEWEEKFGLSPRLLDQRTDADNDGFTALEEYSAKTNPSDPSSQPPLAKLVRFYREEAQLFPYELRKLSAIDPEDKSSWEIDVRLWAPDGRYRDYLGLRLNSPLPPRNQFRIVDGEFRFKQAGGVPVDNHIVHVENAQGERVSLPWNKRVARGDKIVQLFFIRNPRSPRRFEVAPGEEMQLVGAAGVTESYTLSTNAPYFLTSASGQKFPLARLNVNQVRARIQPARPAPANPGPAPLPPRQ